MAEGISEIARKINPKLWDIPSPRGSDQVKVLHRTYINTDNDSLVLLNSVVINIPGRENYTYVNGQKGVYRLKTVFLNYNRNTMTIAFEDIAEDPKFATWRTPFSGKERSKIFYKPLSQNNFVDRNHR